MIETLLIPASPLSEPQEAARRVQIDGERIADIHELVGGYFDIFRFGGPPNSHHGLFVNDNGLIDGLPPNQLATELFHEGLEPNGYLAGPAVMAAFDPMGTTVAPLPSVVEALEGLSIDSDPAAINAAREVLRAALHWPKGVGDPRTPVKVVLL